MNDSRVAERVAIAALEARARPVSGSATDYAGLLERIGSRSLVLLGEATHGTREFYASRAAITRRLIEEKGFCAVAVEADWPDAYRVNQFVQGAGRDAAALASLGDFQRFPSWMWRNTEVVEFVDWLHEFNAAEPPASRRGFVGLDLYSLNRSMAAVIDYLDSESPDAAALARQRYGCFDSFGDDPERYGYLTASGFADDCESQVVAQLIELQKTAGERSSRDGALLQEREFCAEQNARVAKNAEQYYREMYKGRASSWNLRDRHMFETLRALMTHLQRRFPKPKVVVWAHNSHLGDARATSMAELGELNLGQLVRAHYASEAVLVGYTTYRGTVCAADAWGGSARLKPVSPAHRDSVEWRLHQLSMPDFVLDTTKPARESGLYDSLLQRAIGVVYRPETELASHYLRSRLAEQFDVVVHFDRTHALSPLDRAAHAESEPPETFPTGI